MSEEAPVAVGVDVGGTKVVALRIDATGHELARASHATPADDMDATLQTLVATSREVTSEDAIGIGVAAAGMVEWGKGVLRYAPNLAWRDAAIADIVGGALHVPVVVDNDCTAGAFGELQAGAARGFSHVLYVGVGTGIGGGLVLDGSVYRGAHGFAAEVGHIVVDPDGPVCGCGNRGCWETVASGSAITREGRAAARDHPALAALAGGDPDAVTGQIVVEAAREGDPLARGIVERVGRRLGEGLAGLANVLDPELIVVGGGVAGAGDLLLDPARQTFADRIEGAAYRPEVPIVEAALGSDSAAVGAALLAIADHG